MRQGFKPIRCKWCGWQYGVTALTRLPTYYLCQNCCYAAQRSILAILGPDEVETILKSNPPHLIKDFIDDEGRFCIDMQYSAIQVKGYV